MKSKFLLTLWSYHTRPGQPASDCFYVKENKSSLYNLELNIVSSSKRYITT